MICSLWPEQEGGEPPISRGVGRTAVGPRAGWAGVPGNKNLANTTAHVSRLSSDLTSAKKLSPVCPVGILPAYESALCC